MRALHQSFNLCSLILRLFGDVHVHNLELHNDAEGNRLACFKFWCHFP